MFVQFEEYIEKANRAETDEELVQVFLDTVRHHGYDRMTFCLMNDHANIGLKAGAHQLRNYPKDWMDYYFTRDFASVDPVIRYAFHNPGTFSWAEMSDRMNLSKIQKLILNMGADAGLNNGICAPMWSGSGFAGIGLASTEVKDAADPNLDLLTAYCNHFYLAFQRLHLKKRQQTMLSDVHLTSKEREVLLWAARGKSDNDIGDIMKISSHGVSYHLRNIYRKLDTGNRIVAVTKALTLGLINP